MNDNIDIPLQASGEDGIERLIAAIDRLHGRMEGLGSSSPALTRLEQQVQVMQASMTTGFTEMAALLQKGGNEVAAAVERTSNKILSVEQRRDVELNRLRNQALVDYVGWWDKMLDVEQSRDLELHKTRTQAAQRLSQIQQRRDMEEYTAAQAAAQRLIEIEQKRDVELHNMRQTEAQRLAQIQQRRDMEEYTAAQTAAQRIVEIEQKRDVELHNMRVRAAAEAEAAAERQRLLNTSFLTAGPGAQIRTAVQAQTYLQQPGATREGAIERYGSAAVASDVNALRAAHEALAPTVNNSRESVAAHNRAMNEAHSLARGLAGSLGGLWLTYGSLVPLVAGAAIAGSLKQVVDVGSQVEHQLTNVLALTGNGVNLDQFLRVSDGSLHSLVEGSNAMRMLAQNGLNAAQSLQVLPAILDLATVGEMSVGQAALAATGAASAFGLGYSEAGRIADIFAKTAANSNTSVLEITESMKQASTVASLFKVSIEETAGMLGLLAKINVTGGAAGTSLTNMLTGLYEPTEKGKKALKELGVETQLASGQLKPLTQLLEELKGRLSGFTDSARVDLLGSIFTVRGVKSAELALTNIDEFKKKTEEAATASGFMADVVRKLEDDTTGGFQRLGVTVQNSFVRSFAEASPYVQRIALELGDMFKDGGTASTGLQNFATNVARLTEGLVNNLGAVTTVGAGYVAWRVLMPGVVTAIKAATAATDLSTAAHAAAALANATHATAMSAGTATTATYTAMVEANTVAVETATAATVAWEAVLMPVLAAVAIAVGIGAAAWLLFRDNTSEAAKANQKIANSLHVVEDALERENKRLDENLKLWDAKNGKRLAPETVTQSAVDAARTQVKKLEAEARRKGFDPEEIRHPQESGYDAGSGVVTLTRSYDGLAEAIAEADSNLANLESAQKKFSTEVAPKQALEKTQNATAQLRDELEKFYMQGSERDSSAKHELYQQNAAARAVNLKAAPLWENLLDKNQILKDPKEELERVEQIRVSLRKLQDERNAVLAPRAEKVDHKAEMDRYRAQVLALDEEVQQAQKRAQTSIRDTASAYQVGAISAVEAAQKEHDAQVESLNTAIDVAHKKAALARGKENGLADIQRAAKDESAARAGITEADSKLQRDYDEIVRKSAAETTQYRIDQARKAGDTALAYELAHAVQISQTEKGIADSRLKLLEAIQEGDGKAMANASKMLQGFEEAKQRSDEAIAMAVAVDNVTKAEKAFDSLLAKVKAGLSGLRADVQGAGLGAIVSHAFDAQADYNTNMPELQRRYAALQAAANNSGREEDQTKADKALADINKQALQMQQIWDKTGKSIEKSLTDAFGKSGKAAVTLATTMMTYARREQQIRDDLGKSAGSADFATKQKEAIASIRSAQISAYGDMAGAAKGFFKEGTNGYSLLSAAEQAFRLVEVAEAMKAFLVKSGLLTSYLVLKKGTDAAAKSSTASYTMFEVAQAAVRATAHAVDAAVSSMTGWPYPMNLVALGGTLAAIAALGVRVGGGGGGGSARSAEQNQKVQGTGSYYNAQGKLVTTDLTGGVFGDSSAQSKSVARAIELTAANSSTGLNYTQGMYTSLKNIESSLGGLGNLLIRSSGVLDGSNFGVQEGQIRIGKPTDAISNVMTHITQALAGPGLGGKISSFLNNLWGKTSQDIVDSGIQYGGSLRNLEAGAGYQQYANIKTTKSYAFGMVKSSSSSTQTQGLNDELSAQFALVFKGMEDALKVAAVNLGGDAEQVTKALDSLSISTTQMSLKGLTGDALTSAINAVLSKTMDQMAQAVLPALDQFRKVGEGYAETVVRVAADYANVNAILGSIGMTFNATGLASVGAREHLIELAGGIDKLASSTSSFAQNYLTKAEQLAPVAKYVSEQLTALNLGWVDTREELKNVILGLDLTKTADQQLYVSLMALQDPFAKVHAATVDLTKSEQEIFDERADLKSQLEQLTLTEAQLTAIERQKLDVSNRALFDQVQAAKAVKTARDDLNDAYEAEKKNLEDVGDRMGKLSDDWKKLMVDLKLGDKSPLTPQQKYIEARSEFEKTLAAAKGGDQVAQAAYQDVANKFLEASRVANASSVGYTADFNMVMAATDAAATWAKQQVDVAQESLKALKQQVSGLTEVKHEVMSVHDAILKLAEAQAVSAAAGASSPSSAIEALYQGLLGRHSDATGMQFWTDKLSQGVSIVDIANAMRQGGEYMQKPDMVSFGGSSGASAQIMAPQAASSSASTSNGPSAAQVERLISALEGLRTDQANQSQAQVEATMAAAEAIASEVSGSVEEGVSKAAWSAQSGATIE